MIYINNKQVSNLINNFVLSDEFNETLDSGIIKLHNIDKLSSLKPYDDVRIEIAKDLISIPFTIEKGFEIIETKTGSLSNQVSYDAFNYVSVSNYETKTSFSGNAIDGCIRHLKGLQTDYFLDTPLTIFINVEKLSDHTITSVEFVGSYSQTNPNIITFTSSVYGWSIDATIDYNNDKYSFYILKVPVRIYSDSAYIRRDAYIDPQVTGQYATKITYERTKEITTLTIDSIINTYEMVDNVNNRISIDNIEYQLKRVNDTDYQAVYNSTTLLFNNRVLQLEGGDHVIDYIYIERTINTPILLPIIVKRYLVDNYNEVFNKATNKYSYTINLMSETKGLEVIQLPNISITQPIKNSKKISVWQYLNRFLTQYNPKIKVIKNSSEWEYRGKYKLDPALENIYKKVYAPDFSLNNPNLRDLFTNLMITKDRLPTVRNNVIGAMDLTERKGIFNEKGLIDIQSSMSSDTYTQNLKKSYQNALSQDNAIRLVEKLGFRNSDEALLTLSNLRLETRYPIYNINKVLMCYYKRVRIKATSDGTETIAQILCKQDITKIVIPNEKRNLLSKDWQDFETDMPNTIDELAQYRLATIGYDIGSNFITGWGTSYEFPAGWWSTTEKTYIENIVRVVDLSISPLGVNAYNLIRDNLEKGSIIEPYSSTNYHLNIISPFSDNNKVGALKLKGIFFEIDYNGFYNGTLIHSKDNDFGNITINDNPSSSLTLLESDGVFQKEKVNRLGNEIVALASNHESLQDIQELGSVYGDDIVIFKRDISFNNNIIKANYYGSKDYVLKNYFTSVYAKHRTTNLIPFDESVIKAENKKVYLYLSKEHYIVDNYLDIKFTQFDDFVEFDILSAFSPSELLTSKDDFKTPKKINSGMFYKSGKGYLSDISRFVSGNSLGFNIKMYDNVSGGIYIKEKELSQVGSMQDWFILVDDIDTGQIEDIGIYFRHIDDINEYETLPKEYDYNKVVNAYNKLFKLPEQNITLSNCTNLIGNNYKVNKDNKELLDYTLQIETITKDKDIIITPKLMELSDLIGNINKVDKTYTIQDVKGGGFTDQVYVSTHQFVGSEGTYEYDGTLQLNIPNNQINNLAVNNVVNFIAHWNDGVFLINNVPFQSKLEIIAEKIISISTNEIKISGKATAYTRAYLFSIIPLKWQLDYQNKDITMTFKKLGTGTSSSNPLFYNQSHRDSNTTSYGCVIDRVNFQLNAISNGLYNGYQNPSANNCETITGFYILENLDTITTTYQKNMFVINRKEHIKKHAISEELTDSDIDKNNPNGSSIYYMNTTKQISDIFTYDVYNGKPCINIDLTSIQSNENLKTMEFWFYDLKSSSYKLVFAVNVKDVDRARGFIRIYISMLNNGDLRVYNQSHDLIGEVKKLTDNEFNNKIQNYCIIEL